MQVSMCAADGRLKVQHLTLVRQLQLAHHSLSSGRGVQWEGMRGFYRGWGLGRRAGVAAEVTARACAVQGNS